MEMFHTVDKAPEKKLYLLNIFVTIEAGNDFDAEMYNEALRDIVEQDGLAGDIACELEQNGFDLVSIFVGDDCESID